MAHYRTLGIAIGAGIASALLFAVSATGAELSIVVVCLTPLPIMIATLGFGQSSGLVASGVMFFAIVAFLGLELGLVAALLFASPAWWLGYLALLGRPLSPVPAAPGPPQTLMLWYPIGRVVAWGAGTVAGVVLAAGGAVMLYHGGFEDTVTHYSTRLYDILGAPSSDVPNAKTARNVILFLPVVTSAVVFIALMGNLWLAGRIVQRSALLARPWPSLPENLRLPKEAAAMLIVAVLMTLLHGPLRVAGGVVVASVGTAFAFQGLGAAHALTRGIAVRRLILVTIYLITFAIPPALVALTVLGVVDCLFPLRQRTTPSALPPTKT